MNSADLEVNIREYATQLNALEEMLADASCEPANRPELEALKTELEELIEISSDQLLDVRKSEMLAGLEKADTAMQEENCAVASTSSSSYAQDDDSDVVFGANDADDDMMDIVQELIALKCRAPYSKRFGDLFLLRYHNAIVYSVDTSVDVIEDLASVMVTVLYTHPLYRAMVPCRFFLEDRCNFGKQCKHSHGESVLFGDLLEYLEVDVSAIQPGRKCLARDESTTGADKLWLPAEITSTCSEEGKAAVKWINTGRETAVPFGCILPLPFAVATNPDAAPSQPDVPAAVVDPINDRTEIKSEPIPPQAPAATSQQEMGAWEKHTKGIGSKLMAKMGYVVGEGLGKDSDGIRCPVEARLLPKGKSLDYCMENKSADVADKSKKQRRRERIKARRAAQAAAATNEVELTIFDFLNKKLIHSRDDDHVSKQGNPEQHGSEESRKRKRIKEQTSQELNIKSIKLDEQCRSLRKDLRRYQESLNRTQKSKDTVAAAQFKSRLEATKLELTQLNHNRTALVTEQKSRKEKRLAAVF